jgi:hypothetical protein
MNTSLVLAAMTVIERALRARSPIPLVRGP